MHALLMKTARIDSLESFEINGSIQWALLRGNPQKGRVILVVPQGPGLPQIHEARVFEERLRLESEAVVVYWDQRGTGKSRRVDPATINLDQLVADTRTLIAILRTRLGVAKVDLLGFSIGASIAA